MENRWINQTVFAAGALLAVLLLLGALIGIQYGLEDYRVVNAFEDDEAHGVYRVRMNVENHDLNPRGYYHYPYLWFSSGILPIRLFQRLGHNIDTRFIAATFRIISTLGAVGLLFFLFKLGLLWGLPSSIALIAGLSIVATPDVYYWSHMLHPDVPQAAVIVLSFFFAFRSPARLDFYLACLWAGVALSMKFGGVFVIPWLILYRLAYFRERNQGLRDREVRRELAIGFAFFLGIFVLSNPYAFLYAGELVKGVSFIKSTIGRPYNPSVTPSRLDWVPVIAGHLGWTFLALFAAGVALSWSALRRHSGEARVYNPSYQCLFLCVYVITNLLVLMLAIRWMPLRYAYHLVVFIPLIGCYGLWEFARRYAPRLVPIAMIGLLVLATTQFLAASRRMAMASQKPKSQIMALGGWITERYPKTTRVFFDVGTYVPESFPHSSMGSGISELVFKNLSPDVLVLNAEQSGRYTWKKMGKSFVDRDWSGDPKVNERAREIYAILERLASKDSGWKVVWENPSFVVLERERSAKGELK